MQRLEVSCAVRDIYIYNVSRLSVNVTITPTLSTKSQPISLQTKTKKSAEVGRLM